MTAVRIANVVQQSRIRGRVDYLDDSQSVMLVVHEIPLIVDEHEWHAEHRFAITAVRDTEIVVKAYDVDELGIVPCLLFHDFRTLHTHHKQNTVFVRMVLSVTYTMVSPSRRIVRGA